MKTTYSVGEIASILGISAQTLRKYEQKGIISTTREDNNYRSFEAPDITMLFRIRLWRNMGFSFREIQELLDRNRSTDITELYENRIESLQHQIDRLQMMKNSAEMHQQFYQQQKENVGRIRIERAEEEYCFFYRQNRKVLNHFLNNDLLKEALCYSPPFRYVIELPASREEIRKSGYRVGLAISGELADCFPRKKELTKIPACHCATILIRHQFAKVGGTWEDVPMDREFENSGIYRFLEENGLRVSGNIYGLTYFDEIDDQTFYQNIKYYFPIEPA